MSAGFALYAGESGDPRTLLHGCPVEKGEALNDGAANEAQGEHPMES